MVPASEPVSFSSAVAFRDWMAKHHDTASEVVVAYQRRGTGKPSMSWSESVDVALCFGWIDGVRHRIDDERYSSRFTPRRAGSNWSVINIAKVAELTKRGLMTPAGLAAFERRRDDRSGVYSFEQGEDPGLSAEYRAALEANQKATAFFDAQPPGYRRTTAHWVMSARREETRQRRLATLIDDSAAGNRIALFSRPAKAVHISESDSATLPST